MTGLLARAAALVVEPRMPTEPAPPTAPAATRAMVLGNLSSAPPLAAALAGSLRACERAPAALLCIWSPASSDRVAVPPSEPPPFTPPAASQSPSCAASLPGGDPGVAPRAPSRESAPLGAWASAGARRLAARLCARELAVRATGRLAWLGLPDDPAAAARVVGAVLGWLDAPVVTALAGPRPEELDALVCLHDLVVAVRPPDGSPVSRAALAALALDGLTETAACAISCEPLAGGLARWRARGGVARLPAGHPVLEALAGARGSAVA